MTPKVPEPGWARSWKFCQIRIPHPKITLNRHPYCWNHSYKCLAPRVPRPRGGPGPKFFECSTLHDLQNRLQKNGSLYLFLILRISAFPASQPNRVYKRILYLQKCAKNLTKSVWPMAGILSNQPLPFIFRIFGLLHSRKSLKNCYHLKLLKSNFLIENGKII